MKLRRVAEPQCLRCVEIAALLPLELLLHYLISEKGYVRGELGTFTGIRATLHREIEIEGSLSEGLFLSLASRKWTFVCCRKHW